MHGIKTITLIAGLAVSGCSVNDDLRDFQSTIPEQVGGLSWPALVPLGNFAQLSPLLAPKDQRSLAEQVIALRQKAASLRGPVLSSARARAMRAALRRVAEQ
ncbi:MAG: hypothetical protein L3J37_01150 [Rhodobacteraceae bacterium]|nr:hypothetical protein [Paracoccaceae bacterium]